MRCGLVAAALLLAAVAQAQPAGKVHRIGVVSLLGGSPEPPTVRALRQELRELGYVEGRNVVFLTRYGDGRAERLPELFADVIRSKVDVIVAGSNIGALGAKKATTSVPIVFAGVLDALEAGVVTSLARPGGNITGATFGVGGSGLAGKWVELLKEAAPAVSHVAVFAYPGYPQADQLVSEIKTAGAALKMRVDRIDAADDAALDKAFAAVSASKAQGIIVTVSAFFGANRARFIQFAAEKRLPAIYFFNLFPDAGGLMSYGGSLEDSYRRAARHVDKILKGAKPGDLPVDQPTKYEMVINLKAAKALGLTIPAPLLVRADRVIQ